MQLALEAARTRSKRAESSVLWQPFEGKPQATAYHSPADVVGMGGAGGGGKSDLVLGLAMTAHERSIIFRRNFTDLQAMVDRGNEIQDGRCAFIGSPKRRWETPEGRVIELGAVEHESDWIKYKGRPHDLIAFDEAVDLSEAVVRKLMGWLRTDNPLQRCRVVLTFNPPTDEAGEWIIQYFAPWLDRNHVNPARPGELRWYIRHETKDVDVEVPSGEPIEIDGKVYTPQSRTFIPARVEDNPYYMATGYDKQLETLPEPLRSQLRWGNFHVRGSDHAWQVIPSAWLDAAQARWREGARPTVKMRAAGVDVARGGQDNTAIARLYGTWFDELLIYPGARTPDGATGARLVTEAVPDGATPIAVDVIGYGASVYDHLKALANIRALAVNNSGSPPEGALDRSGRYGFTNIRAFSYWMLREALDPELGDAIALPPERRLRVDLLAPRFRVVGSKIAIESKDDIIKRTGFSPDYGDAVVLAWYAAMMGRPLIIFGA